MKVQLGRLLATPQALSAIEPEDVVGAIQRHAQADWGDVCRDDWSLNDEALQEEGRLLSVYHDRNGVKFWIITEADRSATTVLLPDDY
ncbi:MAG: hypothetical protein AB7G11_04880 [Phycisphaerales bacterium]